LILVRRNLDSWALFLFFFFFPCVFLHRLQLLTCIF
jgi:cbb3-type cytochrome oxidase subunit 3